MLLKRVLTVAVLLPLFLAALFLMSPPAWGALLTVVIGLAAWEWARLAGYGPVGRALFPAVLVAAAAGILAWERVFATAFVHTELGGAMFALAAAFWLGIAPAWLYYRWEVRNPVLLGLVGLIVLLPCWYALFWLQSPPARLLLAMCVVWVADTAAYFAGRRFGRSKLAPLISPGKTWAGVYGAVVCVAIYAVIVWLVVPKGMLPLVPGLVLAVLLTVLSVVGDLFESWMKRVGGVKDSSQLLPGHGGLLDRIDGLTATLPLVAIYFAYFKS